MEPLLNGYNAFITGAGSGTSSRFLSNCTCLQWLTRLFLHPGIGKATTLNFARHGAAGLAIADISKDGLDATAALLTQSFPAVKVVPIVLDVTSAEAVKDAVAQAASAFGRLDVAVNNAGAMGQTAMSHELPLESWGKTINLDLNSVFYCQREELAVMMKQEYVGQFPLPPPPPSVRAHTWAPRTLAAFIPPLREIWVGPTAFNYRCWLTSSPTD